MSTYFDAVVVAANQRALIAELMDSLTRFDLALHRAGRGWFVVFAWRAGSGRPDGWDEVRALAHELSRSSGRAVAVHYHDQVSERRAAAYRDGTSGGDFGRADEVWVPYGDDGELVLSGPRFSGAALPDHIECDCIRNWIDAALEAAGFGPPWSSAKLVDVAYRDDPVWCRSGVVA